MQHFHGDEKGILKKGAIMTKQETFEKIVADLTEKGAAIESKIVDFDNADVFWYDGTVVEMKYRDYVVKLFAEGYIALETENGNFIRKPIGAPALIEDETAKSAIVDDNILHELVHSNKACFVETSHIRAALISPAGYAEYDKLLATEDFVEASNSELPYWFDFITKRTQKNPRFFAEEMENIFKSDDKEKAHAAADKLFMETLVSINEGFAEGCKIFKDQHVWYS